VRGLGGGNGIGPAPSYQGGGRTAQHWDVGRDMYKKLCRSIFRISSVKHSEFVHSFGREFFTAQDFPPTGLDQDPGMTRG